MDRKGVYELIDGERAYQDSRWKDLDKRNSVADFLVYIRNYLDNATRSHNADYPAESLNNIRKIAGLCVACMEQHDTPARAK